MNKYNDILFLRQGWQCPKCLKILSPAMDFCPFCSNNTDMSITVNDKTFPNEWIVYHVDDPLNESQIHLDKDWRNKEFFVDYESLPYYNVGV